MRSPEKCLINTLIPTLHTGVILLSALIHITLLTVDHLKNKKPKVTKGVFGKIKKIKNKLLQWRV